MVNRIDVKHSQDTEYESVLEAWFGGPIVTQKAEGRDVGWG
jgi:hypothetical protein